MTLQKAIQYRTAASLIWARQQHPIRWSRNRLTSRAAVLMYHSVGDVELDPWGLYVSPSNFAEHLEVLGSKATVMPLRDLSAACADNNVQHRSVAITFDDGYVNNLRVAKPLLETAAMPATVFIVNDGVDSPDEYWWDQLLDLLCRPGTLPDRLVLERVSSGGPEEVELGAAANYSHEQWQSDHHYREGDGTASPRMQMYHRMWEALIGLCGPEREGALAAISEWANHTPAGRETHRVVSSGQLQELQTSDLIDLGAHTQTHALLPRLDPADQQREINEGKKGLEAMLDEPVDLFSYPFGGHDDTSVALAREAGFTTAVTTEPVTATARTEPMRMPRFDVKNWTGEEFERRLVNWLRFR